jgi:carbonic anhydrase
VKTPRLLALGVLLSLTCFAASHAEEAPAPSRAPREALGALKLGNDRFVRNASAPVSLSQTRRALLAKGQAPFAMVLSCADSRVPPEHVFNVGLGELFVIRAAGEVVDRSIMASLEYGAEHLHIPMLVVLGHESCGAVKAVVDNAKVEGPNLEYMLNAIKAGSRRTSAEKAELRDAIMANVEQVINDALGGSKILRHAVQSGSMQVVGGYYELSSGKVLFSDPITSAPEPKTAPAHAEPVKRQPKAPAKAAKKRAPAAKSTALAVTPSPAIPEGVRVPWPTAPDGVLVAWPTPADQTLALRQP